jgi:glucokinase
MGNALTLIDGLTVIGGEISNCYELFLPVVVSELNSNYTALFGKQFRRLSSAAFNLEDPAQLEKFLNGEVREISVPGSNQTVRYDTLQRVGVGMSRLGTSEAIAIGAYSFALRKLNSK